MKKINNTSVSILRGHLVITTIVINEELYIILYRRTIYVIRPHACNIT